MTTSYRARRLVAAVAALVVGGGLAEAQAQAVITGSVKTDQGQPLVNANVYIADMQISVGTNAQGVYTINIPSARVSGQRVIIRARVFGYTPDARPITVSAGSQTVDFALKQDVNRLSAVVVTGVTAGTEARMAPINVAQVSDKDMPVPGVSPLTQLQGKVPGVTIASTTGRPGASQAVLLRGPQSLNASGRDQGPLYVVDGIVISGGLPDINPLDIETVEVVKGAAAASLFGSRAGNGVIQITTRSGKNAMDGIRFNARSEFGQSDIEREYEYARATMLLTDETGKRFCLAPGSTPGGTQCSITVDLAAEAKRVNENGGDFALAPINFDRDKGIGAAPSLAELRGLFQSTRWAREYNPVASIVTPGRFLNSSIDASGRVGGTSFFASVEDTRNEGAVRYQDGSRRNSVRLNLDQNVGTDWTFGLKTYFSNSENNGSDQDGGNNAFFRLTRQSAGTNLLERDAFGRLYIRSNPLNQGGQNYNPVYDFENWQSTQSRDRFLGNFTAQYKPFSWLDFDTNLGYDRSNVAFFRLRDKGWRTTSQSSANGGLILRQSARTTSYNAAGNAVARWNPLSDLSTRYTLRYIYEQQDGVSNTGSGSTLAAPGLQTLDAVADPASLSISSGVSSIRSIGLMASGDFTYKERYIVSLLARRDGSSLFGSANRWANYGRGSVAWRVAQEPWWFLEPVNELKLRAAVGTAGNRPSFSAQYETFNIGAGGALSASALGNKDLRPETVTEQEYGVDAELWSRVGVQVNYSHSVSKDQILQVPPPAASGFTTQWKNAGTLDNKTWEASLNLPILQRRNLQWSTRLNYDHNRAYITKLDVPEYFNGPGQQGAETMFKYAVGERFGSFYGRKFVTSCSELPSQFAAQCGGAGAQFQKNSDGYIVWTGGHGTGAGITNNLWGAMLPGCRNAEGVALITNGEVTCRNNNGTVTAPWGARINYGTPIIVRDSTGAGRQLKLGNALPDFRASMSHTINYKRFFVYGLFDGSFGRDVWNEGRHWSFGDFMTHETDQLGKSVEEAKPMGYYWRQGAADNNSGIGGFYDALGPNNESVEDASYVKLREVSVSYNIGAVRGVGDWTLSLIGRNLKTWTKYHGFDPEVGLSGGNAGSAAINALDAYSFPNLRTFTIAVNTRF